MAGRVDPRARRALRRQHVHQWEQVRAWSGAPLIRFCTICGRRAAP